jgi:hypothetical protein
MESIAERPLGIEVQPAHAPSMPTSVGATKQRECSEGMGRLAGAVYVLEWIRMRPGHVFLFFLAVMACSRTLPHAPYVPQPTSALVEVGSPPPPGRIEAIPAPPWSSAVWIDGEWAWRRNRWAWKPGAWVEPPPKTRFSPWIFERSPDGRLWVAPGTWRDANGAPVDPPVPLVSADVEPTQIVNAGGVVEVVGRTLRPGATATPSAPP